MYVVTLPVEQVAVTSPVGAVGVEVGDDDVLVVVAGHAGTLMMSPISMRSGFVI